MILCLFLVAKARVPLEIYIKRDWRQLYNYLYIDNYSLLSIKYSKHKSNSFKSTTSYTRNSQILPNGNTDI
jgi:hypothetical protein